MLFDEKTGIQGNWRMAVISFILLVIVVVIAGFAILNQINSQPSQPTSGVPILAMPILFSNHPPTIRRMEKQQLSFARVVIKIMLIIGTICFGLAMLGIIF